MPLPWLVDVHRRTLKQFDFENYPAPEEVYQSLIKSEGWNYKIEKEYYMVRDRAYVSLLYLGCLRVSEILRLRKEQFSFDDPEKVVVRSVIVSKKRYSKGRSSLRSVWLPKTGERSKFTDLVLLWVNQINSDDLLFKFKNFRGWQITYALTGKWNHYFRALGEAYLYDRWGADMLAVADYVNVNPGILAQYIRGAHRKKPSV